MGVPFHNKPGDETSPFDYLEPTPGAGFLYAVCRLAKRQPGDRRKTPLIELQGLATSREMAVRMCRDETYFIGPMPPNALLPERQIPWVGLEWPLLKRPDGDA